ncbi:MAG: hypothetical protein JNL51_00140 [Chitinophagaceae bacterium]|nr:hypothetical protein [Chitinophagaceae bacterium]
MHRSDFHSLRIGDRVYGHYAAKPLYGKLTPEGRVDKSTGFNGDIAALFVPLAARGPDEAELFIAHATPEDLVLRTGKRNWKRINETAAEFIIKRLAENDLY